MKSAKKCLEKGDGYAKSEIERIQRILDKVSLSFTKTLCLQCFFYAINKALFGVFVLKSVGSCYTYIWLITRS